MKATKDTDIRYFTVNGVFDQDRNSVKQLAKTYPCAIPCFGLHPRTISNSCKTTIFADIALPPPYLKL
ncbi:hypothetical protein JHK82_024751 [Glycine max]|nr:hypothetical protein JHK85_025353 [Glycine max]KAG5012608.1 hypothetical protein JHK86_024869 [Glycine max]KAG5133563.1 hypothetical protein JHK82_024751 [Glycine max]